MSNRRRFLSVLGGTSLLAIARAPRAFAADSGAPHHAAPGDDVWDMTWTDRVQGRYRAVFDAPQLAEGAGLFRAIAWCDEYHEVYSTARSDVSPVLVLRHEAIPLAMNNEYWMRYNVGKENKVRTPEGKKWAKANPISSSRAEAKYTLEKLLADGGIVLACNFAFGEVVETVRKAEKLDAKAARARAITQLVPGVILQPSGVFAALRAQEAGCKYIMAS